MINQVSTQKQEVYRYNRPLKAQNRTESNQVSFKGISPEIINVSIIDLLTAILPRTWVDAKTNGFAAAETFRRESSGLIVNCLIPGFIVYGVAKLLEFFNPKDKGMASKWANEEAINTLSNHFEQAKGGSRAFTNKLVKDIDVLVGGHWIPLDKERQNATLPKELLEKLKDFTLESERKKFAKTMADKAATNKDKAEAVDNLVKKVLEQTGGSKNIRVAGKRYHADLHTLLRDAMDVGKDFLDVKTQAIKENKPVSDALKAYFKESKRFINKKSLIGLAIVIPLAASMQSINRWITRKSSGQDGAPIYKDFGKDKQNAEKTQKKKEMSASEKTKFWMKKLGAAGLMVGVAYASLKDKSSIKNIFKGLQFTKNMPTMDQCRWIATTTFASRMLASEDENELKEVTWRDIATFSSLYFLGDYVAKGVGAILQKVTKIPLLNYTKNKPLSSGNAIIDAGKKIAHWASGTELKTFSEAGKVSSKAKALRGVCEASSLGFSMLILGMLVPWYVRKQTERKELAEQRRKESGFQTYIVPSSTGKKTFQAFGMMLEKAK